MDPHAMHAAVVAAVAGDRAAFGELVLATSDQVCGYLAARCSRWEDVEELAQDAFVTAWETLASLREPAAFPGWVKGIARNLLLRQRRTQAQRPTGPWEAVHALIAPVDDDAVIEPDASRLARCLERLPPRARLLCQRRLVEGVPLAVMAQQFKQTRNALAAALSRIRAQLRTCLQQST